MPLTSGSGSPSEPSITEEIAGTTTGDHFLVLYVLRQITHYPAKVKFWMVARLKLRYSLTKLIENSIITTSGDDKFFLSLSKKGVFL